MHHLSRSSAILFTTDSPSCVASEVDVAWVAVIAVSAASIHADRIRACVQAFAMEWRTRLGACNSEAIIAESIDRHSCPVPLRTMSLRARARGVAAAARLAIQGPPLLRLIRLLRRGRTRGREYIDLCLQLGLAARADAALRQMSSSAHHASLPIRLAVLRGRTDEALDLARALASRLADEAIGSRELDAVARCIAPLSAAVALELVRASGRPSRAEPALLLQLGDAQASARRLDELGALLGPQRWLLWANGQEAPARQIEGLNRFFAANSLPTLHLRDATKPPSVRNIGADASTTARRSGGARVSVVMTCYDCATYVDAAIRSVLGQTYGKLELIVIDDASRDDTWERLRSAAADDARVTAVRLRHNVGTYAAKNVGLTLARGNFVAFQDADDWSHPERFAICMGLLRRRPWLQAVSCEYVRLQDDGRFWSSLVWPLQRRTPNSVFFRRRVLERIGFFDEHRFGSDAEFVARLQAAFGPRGLHRIELPLIVAARRDNSLMTAVSTGLDTLGRSQRRADFQEAWTESLLRRVSSGESLYRAARQGTPALIAEASSSQL